LPPVPETGRRTEPRAASAPQRERAREPSSSGAIVAAPPPRIDGVVVAFGVGWLALVAPYLGLLVGRPPSAAYRNVWSLAGLAVLVAIACLAGLGRRLRGEERRFRTLVAAAFLVWAASELVEHLLAGIPAASRRAVGDSSFVVFGVLMCAAALVASERGLSPAEAELRRLHRGEVALFATGIFVGLVVLPTRHDPELAASPAPSAVLYLTIDLLMLGLFLRRRAKAGAGDRRWAALAGASALFVASDALFLAATLGRFDLDRHVSADLLWFLPHPMVVYAVRAAAVRESRGRVEPGTPRGIAPGFLYSALVPVVYLAAESAGAASAAGGDVQRRFALGLTVTMLGLAVLHQRRQRAVWNEVRGELAAGARRRAAVAKLEAIGRLAAGVAHDFNNLLTVIVGRAELARSRLAGAAERRDLDGILEVADRATALTSELLAVGEREPRLREPVELDAFVASRRERLAERAGAAWTVELELAAPGGRLVVDPGHLDRVLDNLISNALDAMPAGGRLTVATRRESLRAGWTRHLDEVAAGAHLVLEVRDEGVGMSPELLARIFEPFFTTKDLGRGFGLGLATVRGLVRQNGGQIVAHSRPGEGTRFELYFPEEA
jgi:signal transduction histidine kinase